MKNRRKRGGNEHAAESVEDTYSFQRMDETFYKKHEGKIQHIC